MGKKAHINKHKTLPKPLPTAVQSPQVPETLRLLAEKRVGGSVNLKGIHFQVLYATYVLLTRLGLEGKSILVRLEGVEDIDLYLEDKAELIQVKTSQHQIDAGKLWNMGVVRNFLEAFKLTPSLKLVLVHNSALAKGKLLDFQSGNFTEDHLRFWEQKFQQKGITVPRSELKQFLGQVKIESFTETHLTEEINRVLVQRFNINTGTEHAFHHALFHMVFQSSKDRRELINDDICSLIQSVKDSFSKFPENPAAKHNWITAVSYVIPEDKSDLSYYDGKNARPTDIARELPIHRPEWDSLIKKSISDYDITVIKSSSGQGKSTLGWQMGYEFMKRSFSIYQLQICTHYNEATAICDFIESRLTIGEIPLLIIDGLNQQHAAWNELAKLLREKPVKVIITTREEDWVRFGDQLSSVVLNIVDIKLSIKEASAIYSELKNNQKLHTSITAWQPAWEKVKDRGLMIEYIYLLTRGQMIEERLSSQINTITKEPGSALKLELLRLIAVSDILGIKLKTQNITNYIRTFISTDTDRNELYRQLEQEYYLRFEKMYVEGLHQVRSEHLVKLLHSHTPVQESLLSILSIIEDETVYDFFMETPQVFDVAGDETFFRSAAAVISSKTIAEMVYAIDGLMHLEPLLYWKVNKAVFNEIFKTGGLELFIYESAPFNPVSYLKNLADSMSAERGTNIFKLIERKKDLTSYVFKDSMLARFTQFLKSELEKKGEIQNPEGIAFLYKWFKQAGTSFPNIVTVNEEKLLYFLENKSIGESSELFHFYSILDREAYKTFAEKNRERIIGLIKRKTNTLSIEEKDRDIHINYLLDSNPEKANEYSVYRIEVVHAFFPFFEHYCTRGIILPFPNEQIYKVVLDNSTKRMKPGALGDDFYVHINQIWSRTILDQYGARSSYEWQHIHQQFREHCLDLMKRCTRLLEAYLEKNTSAVTSMTRAVISASVSFFNLDTVLPKHPSTAKKYFDHKPFEKEQSKIANWQSSFRNFISQLNGLVNPKKENDRRLPVINLKSAVFKLSEMQESYEKIRSATYGYFSTEKLRNDEQQWLTRLLHTAEFYTEQAKQNFETPVIVAARSVSEWHSSETNRKLEELHQIIREYEEESYFDFFLPTRIIEEELITTAVIGVSGIDIGNQDELFSLSLGLSGLAKTDIHYFILVWINAQQQATGSMRFRKEYFEAFDRMFESQPEEDIDFGTPLALIPDEKQLAVLDNISLLKLEASKEDTAFFNMMMNLWKLTEHRRRLNNLVPAEKSWLLEIENDYRLAIQEDLKLIKFPQGTNSSVSLELIEKILNNVTNPSPEEIVQILNERSMQIQKKITLYE